MTTNNDVFDLNNLGDIPKELIGQLKLSSKTDKQILNLFSFRKSGILNLSELLVSYYRVYKEEKTRNYLMTACYRMVKKGFLKNTKHKGEYILTDFAKEYLNDTDGQTKSNETGCAGVTIPKLPPVAQP